MARTVPVPPEQGQLVHHWQRRYIVTDVAMSPLLVSRLRIHRQRPQHLVTLMMEIIQGNQEACEGGEEIDRVAV